MNKDKKDGKFVYSDSFIRTLSMFNSTVIGTDFVSFTSFAVVIFLVDFLEELFGLVPLDILFGLTFNNNKCFVA